MRSAFVVAPFVILNGGGFDVYFYPVPCGGANELRLLCRLNLVKFDVVPRSTCVVIFQFELCSSKSDEVHAPC